MIGSILKFTIDNETFWIRIKLMSCSKVAMDLRTMTSIATNNDIFLTNLSKMMQAKQLHYHFSVIMQSYFLFQKFLPKIVQLTIFRNISLSLTIRSPIFGFKGSQPLGQVSRYISPQIIMVRVTVGEQSQRTRGRQTAPQKFMLGWQSLWRHFIFGGSMGQVSGKVSWKVILHFWYGD